MKINKNIKGWKKVNPPTDFFKGIKTCLKSVLKHPDINLPKITIFYFTKRLVFNSSKV